MGEDTHRAGLWKGWYYSGAAPHRDVPGVLQFITFRLADSLPQTVLRRLREEAERVPLGQRERFRRRSIESWLDAGLGSCVLARPEVAAMVRDTLLHHDGERYRLVAWCIMPNHIHVLIEPRYSLPRIIQTWKSVTTRWVLSNSERLQLGVVAGNLWMRDYWDRFIRDEQHFQTAIHYIHQNPVKAGLCVSAEQWRWSSAWGKAQR